MKFANSLVWHHTGHNQRHDDVQHSRHGQRNKNAARQRLFGLMVSSAEEETASKPMKLKNTIDAAGTMPYGCVEPGWNV